MPVSLTANTVDEVLEHSSGQGQTARTNYYKTEGFYKARITEAEARMSKAWAENDGDQTVGGRPGIQLYFTSLDENDLPKGLSGRGVNYRLTLPIPGSREDMALFGLDEPDVMAPIAKSAFKRTREAFRAFGFELPEVGAPSQIEDGLVTQEEYNNRRRAQTQFVLDTSVNLFNEALEHPLKRVEDLVGKEVWIYWGPQKNSDYFGVKFMQLNEPTDTSKIVTIH